MPVTDSLIRRKFTGSAWASCAMSRLAASFHGAQVDMTVCDCARALTRSPAVPREAGVMRTAPAAKAATRLNVASLRTSTLRIDAGMS